MDCIILSFKHFVTLDITRKTLFLCMTNLSDCTKSAQLVTITSWINFVMNWSSIQANLDAGVKKAQKPEWANTRDKTCKGSSNKIIKSHKKHVLVELNAMVMDRTCYGLLMFVSCLCLLTCVLHNLTKQTHMWIIHCIVSTPHQTQQNKKRQSSTIIIISSIKTMN